MIRTFEGLSMRDLDAIGRVFGEQKGFGNDIYG